jgi:NADH-quinone oxidoreductase subunit F
VSAVADDASPLTRFKGVAWNAEGWRGLSPASRHPFFAGERRVTMERCGHLHPVSLDDALLSGGYSALADVLGRQTPEDVLEAVKEAGPEALRAAAAEWEVCQNAWVAPRYFVASGAEGALDAFPDRHLMEGDPQRVLEGLVIAAYAAGATRGVIQINGAARLSFDRMSRALAQAQAVGLIGDRILGGDFSFHVEIRRSARGFVRGEERALIASIEGRRASTRTGFPLPHEAGLWGKPTAISNVDTLAAVPLVFATGREGCAGQRG